MPSTLARAVHRTVDRGAKNLSYTPVNAAEDQADSIAADASRARRRCRGECEEMTVNDKDADRRTARVALFPPLALGTGSISANRRPIMSARFLPQDSVKRVKLRCTGPTNPNSQSTDSKGADR